MEKACYSIIGAVYPKHETFEKHACRNVKYHIASDLKNIKCQCECGITCMSCQNYIHLGNTESKNDMLLPGPVTVYIILLHFQKLPSPLGIYHIYW